MFSTAEKNYLINIVLGVIGLACIATGLLLKFKIPALMAYVNIKALHEWTGYIMAALVVLHFVMHLKWLQALTRSMLQNKQKLAAAILALVFSIGLFAGLIAFSPAGKAPAAGRNGSIPQTDVKHLPASEKTN